MTAIKYFIPLYLLILASCGNSEKKASYGTFEAESGQYINMIPLPDEDASGGSYLSMETDSEVKWKFPVNRSGYFQVVIRYRAPGGDKMQYLLKNGEAIGVGFDMAPDWNLCSQPFHLDSGINTLGIRSGWGGMDIDRIEIKAAETELSITPRSNLYYLNNERDLVFKIENFDQEVKRVILDGKKVKYDLAPYPYQEFASWLTVRAPEFSSLAPGKYNLDVELDQEELRARIEVLKKPEAADMIMIAPDVEHGSAMLIKLPSGRFMLIDCGKDWVRDSILVPMFRRHGVDSIQTFILTHYHGDHDGGDGGQFIKENFRVKEFIDYQTHPTGYEWIQDGVRFRILNSYSDGSEENTRSLSLAISYEDFKLVHGGDTYASNQEMILQRFPEEVKADVFYANHHFHGSVDPDYILATNPDLVILQAQEAIYARAAYMVKYKKESVEVLNRYRNSQVETLPALEVGTIVLRVNGDGDWTYESYRDQDHMIIPGF